MQAQGSRTETQHNTPQPPVLRLRSSDTTDDKKDEKSKARVKWTEDVVDNEHMNKKKSKICCIFHPQKNFDESSGESLSGSSSDSLDDEDASQKPKDGHCCKRASPNAYERQPHYANKSVLPGNAI